MPDIRLEFGRTLRSVRKTKGYSQQELADRVALSRPSIVNIELGRQGISLEQLYVLASALGVSAAELLPNMTAVLDGSLLRKLETHKGHLPDGTAQWVASVVHSAENESK
jgi:transcriptional regulator with XRE-family HTH domain